MRRPLEQQQGRTHYHQTALHVGEARPTKTVSVQRTDRPKRTLDPEYRVVMPGQSDAQRCVWALADGKRRRVLDRPHCAIGLEPLTRRQRHLGDLAAEFAEGLTAGAFGTGTSTLD